MNLKYSIALILLISLNLSFQAYAMEQDIQAEKFESTGLLDLPNELVISINNLLKPLPNASAEQIIECFEDLLALSQSSKSLHELLESEIINHIQKNIDQYGAITNFSNDNLLSLALKEKRYRVAALFLKSSMDFIIGEALDLNEAKLFFAWAITNGHLDIARVFLRFIPKAEAVNMQDKTSKKTLLHLSAQNSNEGCVKLLLESGADVNIKDHNNNIPLDWAARRGDLDIVKLLVKYGSDVNNQNKLNYYTATPLKLAIIYGKKEVAEFLLDNGAEIESCDNDDFSPIEVALLASYDNNESDEIIASLLSHGAKKTNVKNIIDKDRALFFAVQKNLPKAVKVLLQKGADIEAKNHLGMTPLLTAVAYGNIPTVKALIDLGADTNCKTGFGNNILIAAINDKNFELCQLLVKYKELINEPGEKLNSPLHFACEYGNFKIIKLLIACGADINSLNSNNESPLAFVIVNNSLPSRVKCKTIKYLVKKGANVNLECSNGYSILLLALDNLDPIISYEVIDFLIQKGAYVNFIRKGYGTSPIIAATYSNKLDIVNLLINHGADINAGMNHIITALDIAKERGFKDIIQILTEAKKRGHRYKH